MELHDIAVIGGGINGAGNARDARCLADGR
jgi:glycerol-3-phosphate dehydrogenase